MPEKTIYNSQYRTLIVELKASRLDAHQTQEEAGRRVGRCRTWLSKIETFEIRLDVLDFVRLCRALGLEAGALIKRLEADMM